MISCPKCGKENQDHYKFCLGCGNELPRDGGGQRPFQRTPPAGVASAAGAGGGAGAGAGAQMAGPPMAGPPRPATSGYTPAQQPPPVAFGGAPAPAPIASPPPVASPAAAAKPAIPSTCPLCGSPNPRGNRFCITCGNDLASAPTPGGGGAPAPTPGGGGAPIAGGGNFVEESTRVGGAASMTGAAAAPAPAMAPPASAPAFAPSSSPAARPSLARLVLIRPDGSEGGVFQLNEGATIIGRETGPLFANDNFLSPRHATFTVNGTTVTIRDENALNGVYVRIERQQPVEVKDGEIFRIGQEILRYEAFKPVQAEPDGTERQGAQIEGLIGRISLIIGRDVTGNSFPVPVTGLFLGRERGDILFPEDGYVSGLHCQLTFEGGRMMLTDVGSSNGTYIRLLKGAERRLVANDLLLLGQQLFRLTF